MRKALGTFVLGLAGGWLLSRLRAMPGGDLFAWAAPHMGQAVALRVIALSVIAFAVWKARAGVRWPLLFAITIGYGLHGFVDGPAQGLPWVGLVVAAIVAWIGSGWVRVPTPPPDSQDGTHGTNVGEMLGLFVAGGGAAVALESVARHVRPLGSGLAQDDTAFGFTFLLFVTFGAAAFGWIASTHKLRRLSFPVLLAGTTATCYVALGLLDYLADFRGLSAFTRRFGLRSVDHGTLAWDMLIGAGSFVLPALLLGAAIAGARGRRALTSAILGAACGLIAVMWKLDRGIGAQSSEAEIFSAQLVPFATMVAVAGAALAVLSESRRRPAARYVALVLTLACVTPVLGPSIKPIFVLAPWEQRVVMPYLAFDTPAGLATVEPSRGGMKVARLDRRLLTPETIDAGPDAQRLIDSFALMSEERRKSGAVRVLLVGQLTWDRAWQLKELGATRVDRSAAWWKAMPRLEVELFKFGDESDVQPMPAGEVLDPAEARARIASGQYDIVVALPGSSDAPAVAPVEAPASTVVVRWLTLDEPLRGVAHHEPAVLSAAGLYAPSLGVVTNAAAPAPGDTKRPRAIESSRWDAFVPTPLAWLLVREMNRTDKARATAFKALAAGWYPTPTPFVRGLADHFAVQLPSSPYEKEADRVEISDTALKQLSIDAQHGLDAFTRPMWEWFARVLLGKRDVERIDQVIAPLAAAHAPWPELEVTLAYADLEGLDAPAAVARLTPLVAAEPNNAYIWFALGEAREIAGDIVGTARAFQKADELAPGDVRIRRRLAMAACRANDPLGRTLAQEIVSANPDDTEMKAYLEPGAPPPAPKAYQPARLTLRELHDHAREHVAHAAALEHGRAFIQLALRPDVRARD